jgi:nitrous oxide reductase accessory protein NosL
VLGYYDHARIPLDDAVLVVGSDVAGPMGPDFIPMRSETATAFVADHGGRAMSARDVTAATIDGLERP